MEACYRQAQALLWCKNHETVRIEPWGLDSLRGRATMGPLVRDDLVGALLPLSPTGAAIDIGKDFATIRNGAITAEVSSDGCLCFVNALSHAELLAEKRPVRATRISARMFKGMPGDLFHLEARFRAYADERLYGLGQHQHGLLDQMSAIIELVQRNTEVTIPFLFSSRSYDLLWNNPAVGRVVPVRRILPTIPLAWLSQSRV